MTVSATTNGGFDLTGQSLIPYKKDYIVQMIHMLLIILGAIGFPVLMEVKQFLSKRETTIIPFFIIYKIDDNNIFALVVVGTIMIFYWREIIFSRKVMA